MKNIILITLLFVGISSQSIAQNYISNALRTGKNSELFYEAIVPENTLLTPEKLSNWSKKNNEKYLIIDYKTRDIWFAGSTRKLISWFAFVEVNDLSSYNSMQIEKIKNRAIAAEQKAKFDIEMVGVIFGTAVLAYHAIGYVMKKAVDVGFVSKEDLVNPRSNNSSYSSSSNDESSSGNDEIAKEKPNRTQSTDDLKNGYVTLPSYTKDKSSGTYSPTGLRGEHYSYWVDYKENGIKKANIYAPVDGSYYAVDFTSWYKYDSFENAVKAWYIYKKFDVIMKEGRL